MIWPPCFLQGEVFLLLPGLLRDFSYTIQGDLKKRIIGISRVAIYYNLRNGIKKLKREKTDTVCHHHLKNLKHIVVERFFKHSVAFFKSQ